MRIFRRATRKEYLDRGDGTRDFMSEQGRISEKKRGARSKTFSTNVRHADAQRCTDRDPFFLLFFFIFFYSLANRRLRGSAALL